jgi:hypothetical protein
MLQIVADHKLGDALGSQPTLSRWENAPSARDLVRLSDTLREQFIRLCGDHIRPCGEILANRKERSPLLSARAGLLARSDFRADS